MRALVKLIIKKIFLLAKIYSYAVLRDPIIMHEPSFFNLIMQTYP